jgi:hypothetical protein
MVQVLVTDTFCLLDAQLRFFSEFEYSESRSPKEYGSQNFSFLAFIGTFFEKRILPNFCGDELQKFLEKTNVIFFNIRQTAEILKKLPIG